MTPKETDEAAAKAALLLERMQLAVWSERYGVAAELMKQVRAIMETLPVKGEVS